MKITTSKTSPTTITTSTSKYDWCYLDNYDVAVQQRLNSSKDIILVDEIDNKTYKQAKSVCENICGRLYLPSTLKENDEVESVLNSCLVNRRCGYDIGNVWLRMTYNETVGIWYDPDNKEDLTFLNFHSSDVIRECSGNLEHHAVMNYINDGKWWSRTGTHLQYTSYVLCELT